MLPQNPQQPDEPYTPETPTTPSAQNFPESEAQPETLSTSAVDAEPRSINEPPVESQQGASSSGSTEPVVTTPSSSAVSPEAADVTSTTQPSVNDPVNVPLATENESNANPVLVTSTKKRSKWIVIGIVVAALIVLLGGAYAAYALWYSNTTKVATDAVHQLITSKSVVTAGTVLFESGADNESMKVEVNFSSKVNGADVNGEGEANLKITGPDKKKFEVTGAGLLSTSGAFYFKFEGVSKIIDQYTNEEAIKDYLAANPQLKTNIDAFIKKIDGSWVKVDQEFIREYIKDFDYNKTKQCFQKAYDGLQKNSAQQNQLKEVYAKNEFLKLTPQGMEAVNGTWTNKYGVEADVSKVYDAEIAYEKTDFAKATNDCMKDLPGGGTDATKKPSDDEIRERQQEIDKAKVTLYIASLGHELKRVEVKYAENDSKTSVDTRVDMSSNVSVDTKDPAKSISLKELQTDIEKIQKEFEASVPNTN